MFCLVYIKLNVYSLKQRNQFEIKTVYDFALRNTLSKGTSCENQEQGN